MDRGITFLEELQKMKQKMDRTWGELFEEDPRKEPEVGQWVEKIPKFEGTKRRTLKSRANKTIKPF
jgi:hypothetical protein